MMEIKNVLDENMICVLEGGNKKECLLELIGFIENSKAIQDVRALKENIFHREQLMSTGIGLGIAVPHTRMAGVSKPVMAVGIAPAGIKDYESIDGEEIRILVLIVCGRKQHKEYISLLSTAVNALKNEDRRKSLFAAKSGKEAFRVLCG